MCRLCNSLRQKCLRSARESKDRRLRPHRRRLRRRVGLPQALALCAAVSFGGLLVLGILGALFLALNLLSGKLHTNSYLVVMRYTPEGESAVRSKLGTLGKYKLKSRTMNLAETELVVEAKLSQKQMDSLEALLDNEGVSDVNIVSYNGSTLL